MADGLPYWLEVVKASGPTIVALVIGGIATMIAYRQWRTAKDKLRLDLFERRLAVYDLIERYRARVLQNGSADTEDIRSLHEMASRSEFLFGRDVTEFIEKLKREWQVLVLPAGKVAKDEASRREHLDRQYEIKKAYLNQDVELRKLFTKYLSFGKLKS
ncbi:hypothetical protein LGR54_20250 [Ancylobacter sp. Lp-2]|uniref:hypothetical protein n=1 Tax=Ancylobacter sp. Lp-2 TaxID=2881339 RepID=UPI001E57DBB1|nr:hypothetical protein [Ancylobacter sp. Lp-2]MCB4770946.1 hypothetical protein [Ancylobacter sp. Lp-2]